VGASLCYLLSYLVGRRIVLKYWPEKAAQWAAQVDSHKDHLLNYIIFLRITPMLPNWFINITSPIVDVPLKQFFIGTFLGINRFIITIQKMSDFDSEFISLFYIYCNKYLFNI
jgi:uncharacterized membrane protein YdjX (TVP38/TMEM64 family)